jgi:hypothetical protein
MRSSIISYRKWSKWELQDESSIEGHGMDETRRGSFQ